MKENPIAAHQFCTSNRKMLEKDNLCGCFYCLEIFNPKGITGWIEDRDGDTALYPYCNIDSIISKSSGYPLTKKF
ncbi:cytoplasmic protein [Mycoplasmatota bacterium]|nr:cytoplasmic protein [Mycoplasmatota bacterium]